MQTTPEFDRRVEKLLAEFSDYKKSLTPTLLQLAVEEFGSAGNEVLAWVSGLIEVPKDEVFAIAKYLDLIQPQPRARHRIFVCTHIHCTSAGSQDCLEQLERRLGIPAGEKSGDGNYELQKVQCLGCCEQAPTIQVNRGYFVRVTPDRISQILDSLSD